MVNQYTNGWKKKEINYLRENYGKIFVKIIAKKLNRSYCAIRRKAEKLKLYSPFSDFKNHNPAKMPSIKEKIRLSQQKRWDDKNSILNSKEYREKQSKSLKKMWKNPPFNVFKRNKKIGLKNKGKFRTEKMKTNYSKIHKKLWGNPNSTYNSKEYKNELKKRVKEMLNNQHLRPTLPERQVTQIIKLNNLPFKYTGNNKLRIKNYNPDFVNKNLKCIIEVNGEYWHKDKMKETKKRKKYNSLGYKFLVIWSKELENPQKVAEKIIHLTN